MQGFPAWEDRPRVHGNIHSYTAFGYEIHRESGVELSPFARKTNTSVVNAALLGALDGMAGTETSPTKMPGWSGPAFVDQPNFVFQNCDG